MHYEFTPTTTYSFVLSLTSSAFTSSADQTGLRSRRRQRSVIVVVCDLTDRHRTVCSDCSVDWDEKHVDRSRPSHFSHGCVRHELKCSSSSWPRCCCISACFSSGCRLSSASAHTAESEVPSRRSQKQYPVFIVDTRNNFIFLICKMRPPPFCRRSTKHATTCSTTFVGIRTGWNRRATYRTSVQYRAFRSIIRRWIFRAVQ